MLPHFSVAVPLSPSHIYLRLVVFLSLDFSISFMKTDIVEVTNSSSPQEVVIVCFVASGQSIEPGIRLFAGAICAEGNAFMCELRRTDASVVASEGHRNVAFTDGSWLLE